MDWVKAITELLKALAHFAWPALVLFIVLFFRNEIPKLLNAIATRIRKFKGFGIEIEAEKAEVQLDLANAKAGIPAETIQQIKATVKSEASVTVRLVESLPLLVEMASTHPREAIKLSWDRLAQRVLQVANVSGNDTNPYSPALLAAIKILELSTEFSDGLVRSIKNLQEIARKAFNQSQYAYDPSSDDAEQFVLYSAAARSDLGEDVK